MHFILPLTRKFTGAYLLLALLISACDNDARPSIAQLHDENKQAEAFNLKNQRLSDGIYLVMKGQGIPVKSGFDSTEFQINPHPLFQIKHIENVQIIMPDDRPYKISFILSRAASAHLSYMSADNIGKDIAIVLDNTCIDTCHIYAKMNSGSIEFLKSRFSDTKYSY